jgi:hypothetical protein
VQTTRKNSREEGVAFDVRLEGVAEAIEVWPVVDSDLAQNVSLRSGERSHGDI